MPWKYLHVDWFLNISFTVKYLIHEWGRFTSCHISRISEKDQFGGKLCTRHPPSTHNQLFDNSPDPYPSLNIPRALFLSHFVSQVPITSAFEKLGLRYESSFRIRGWSYQVSIPLTMAKTDCHGMEKIPCLSYYHILSINTLPYAQSWIMPSLTQILPINKIC